MHTRIAFLASDAGTWRVVSQTAVSGPALEPARHIDIVTANEAAAHAQPVWRLDGIISNVRYAIRNEVMALKANSEPLNRPGARHAALIPIKKSAAWWALAQDERRAIFEETSHHTALGLKYLPAVARQLYHCRDINQPFDFLTWFEYAPEHANDFEELVRSLRATLEWTYVEREIDIRLERD